MEKKEIITGAKGEWTNNNVAGAYKVTHVKSGKFYVGSTGNFYRRRSSHLVDLRSNKHHVKELQQLYNETPEIHFELFLTGYDKRARELAYDHEQSMLDDNAKNPLLLNKSSDARKPVLDAELEALRLAKSAETNRLPENRTAQSIRSKIHRNTPEAKSKASADTSAQWSDAEKRKAIMGNRDSEESRKANVERNKEQWKDPEYRKKMNDLRSSEEARERLKQAIADSGRTKRVQVKGVVYNSLTEAERQTGILRKTIARRCDSELEKNSEYKYVD